MAVKSILEIDVQDDKFKDFQKAFNKYQAAVKELPASWKDQAKEAQATTDVFTAMTAQLKLQAQIQHNRLREEAEAEKKAQEADRRRKQAITDQNQGLKSALSTTRSIVTSIQEGTVSLLKWAGIGAIAGGLLGLGGGILGMEGLASEASDIRRFSKGVGVSPGQGLAASVAFGRYGDTRSLLENLASAGSNPALYGPLAALGIANPGAMSPSDLMVEFLTRSRALMQRTPRGMQGAIAGAYGLTNIAPMDTLRNLGSTSEAEFQTDLKAYRQKQKEVEVTDAVLKKYQDLTLALDLNRKILITNLLTALAPLSDSFKALGTSLVDFVSRIAKDPVLQQMIKDFAANIELMAKNFDSKKFADGVNELIHDIPIMADKIHNFVEFWSKPPQKNLKPNVLDAYKWHPRQDAPFGSKFWHGIINDAASGLAAGSTTAPAVFGFLPLGAQAALWAEGKFSPWLKNPNSTAYGSAQWTKSSGRQDLFANVMHEPLHGSSLADQAKFIQWELMNTSYGHRTVEAMNRATTEAGKAQAFIHNFEAPDAKGEKQDMGLALRFLAEQHQRDAHRATNTRITLHDNTANKPVVTMNQYGTAGG